MMLTVAIFFKLFGFFRPTSYKDLSVTGKRLQSLTYARHSWPLNSERSLACHTYLTSVYNGYLRRPVTFTHITEHLTVELSLPVLTTWVCHGWDSNTQPFFGEGTLPTAPPLQLFLTDFIYLLLKHNLKVFKVLDC